MKQNKSSGGFSAKVQKIGSSISSNAGKTKPSESVSKSSISKDAFNTAKTVKAALQSSNTFKQKFTAPTIKDAKTESSVKPKFTATVKDGKSKYTPSIHSAVNKAQKSKSYSSYTAEKSLVSNNMPSANKLMNDIEKAKQMRDKYDRRYEDETYYTGEMRRSNIGSRKMKRVNAIRRHPKFGIFRFVIPIFVIVMILFFCLGQSGCVRKQDGDDSMSDNNANSSVAVNYYNSLQLALHEYDAETLDSLVGTESGDSYLAQEWAYVNGVSWRENFLLMVGKTVEFSSPTNETVSITCPDYNAIMIDMEDDKSYIEILFSEAGSQFSDLDYNLDYRLTNLMLQYILEKYIDDKGNISVPITTVTVPLELRLSSDGSTYYLASDANLDDVLFGSDYLRNMSSKFSQICLGWTGEKEETYQVQETIHNPEFESWVAEFMGYYNADNGKFTAGRSKWEPFYLRDTNNHIVKYGDAYFEQLLNDSADFACVRRIVKDGDIYNDIDLGISYGENDSVVDYYVIIADGQYKVQPEETVTTWVDRTRMVDDPWINETGISFTWCGTNYIQNVYRGRSDTYFRIGDGSIDNPAGIGTKIITKVLCTDGQFHDVKIALMGYWVGQDAIDYAERFSQRNHGFTTTSAIQLITFEVYIENLEDAPIEIVAPDMTLSDKNSIVRKRLGGTIYGFTESLVIEPHNSVIVNDWCTSTELEQKYVAWGDSFGRLYSPVFFNILAGSGYIPPYSAYEYFTGKSSMEDSADTQ